MYYNLYSSNLIYTNVKIATALRGCAHSNNSKYM